MTIIATQPPPGAMTCGIVRCPGCGAYLEVCSQALAPEYLIENAQCPRCGAIVAHWVVSIRELTLEELISMVISTVMVIGLLGFVMYQAFKVV